MREAGFTSCVSAASAKKRLDIVLRNAIDRGEFPGPRMLAASPEMTVTGGLGDVRLPHLYRENFAVILDGADEFRRFAQEVAAPLLANMTEFGKSPNLDFQDLARLGYRVVIYPVTAREAQAIRWVTLVAPLLSLVIIFFLSTASMAG